MDHVGSQTFWKSVECLRRGGRFVFIGTTTGSEAKIDIRYIFVREIELLGVYMGPNLRRYKVDDLFDLSLCPLE